MVNLDDASRVMERLSSAAFWWNVARVSIGNIAGLKPKYILADEPTSVLGRDNRDMIF